MNDDVALHLEQPLDHKPEVSEETLVSLIAREPKPEKRERMARLLLVKAYLRGCIDGRKK